MNQYDNLKPDMSQFRNAAKQAQNAGSLGAATVAQQPRLSAAADEAIQLSHALRQLKGRLETNLERLAGHCMPDEKVLDEPQHPATIFVIEGALRDCYRTMNRINDLVDVLGTL